MNMDLDDNQKEKMKGGTSEDVPEVSKVSKETERKKRRKGKKDTGSSGECVSHLAQELGMLRCSDDSMGEFSNDIKKKKKRKHSKSRSKCESKKSKCDDEGIESNTDSEPNGPEKIQKKNTKKKTKKSSLESSSQLDDEKLCRLKKKKKKRDKELNGGPHVNGMQEKSFEYLMKWKRDKPNWKFEKLKQIWLLQNAFDPAKVSNNMFPLLLEYIINVRGKARAITREKALKFVQDMEQRAQLLEKGMSELELLANFPHLKSLDEESYNRARNILQYIPEEPELATTDDAGAI